MNGPSIDHRAAHQVSPGELAHRGHRRRATRGDEAQDVSLHAKHLGIVCAAQASGTLRNGVEDRLRVGWRAADHLQNIACRSLLLQSLTDLHMGCCESAILLLQLREQPHVLNGDYGLVGEGLEERNLLLAEELNLRSAELDASDGDALS